MEVSERISLIIEHYNENKSTFSKRIGLTNTVTIGRLINEKRNPSFDLLYRISKTFPEINTRWLLTGEGVMIQQGVGFELEDLDINQLLRVLLDKNNDLLDNDSFRNYIRTNMEYLMVDEEREKKKNAIEELRKIAHKKLKKKDI